MKTYCFINEAAFLKWQEEIRQMREDIRRAIVPLAKENVLMEPEVCQLLGVTDRTLRKYRKLGYIGFVKLNGRIIYLKHLLYEDLLRLYYEHWQAE